jgi:hypothetical protein
MTSWLDHLSRNGPAFQKGLCSMELVSVTLYLYQDLSLLFTTFCDLGTGCRTFYSSKALNRNVRLLSIPNLNWAFFSTGSKPCTMGAAFYSAESYFLISLLFALCVSHFMWCLVSTSFLSLAFSVTFVKRLQNVNISMQWVRPMIRSELLFGLYLVTTVPCVWDRDYILYGKCRR